MTKRIDFLWTELENDHSFSHGLLLRRYSGTVVPDVFVALSMPERYRCIAISVGDSDNANITEISRLRDMNIELIPDETKPNGRFLIFTLVTAQYKDVFSVLCEDLIAGISSVSDQALLIKELLRRFEKWRSLFDKVRSQGLTPEEQRGLYGELFFLRKYLKERNNFLETINSWAGPEKQNQDFQCGDRALEVKTTYGNNPQRIHINNERQLDTTHLESLFLYHLSLDARQHSGETLNQIVDSISEMLAFDSLAFSAFNNKLMEIGYFVHHREMYKELGYKIRRENYFEVREDFPRIEEKDIRTGVGEIKYSIVLDLCQRFSLPEDSVFKKLNKV